MTQILLGALAGHLVLDAFVFGAWWQRRRLRRLHAARGRAALSNGHVVIDPDTRPLTLVPPGDVRRVRRGGRRG